MTEKNAFLKFVHKNIEDFTPQQMELATRILKGDRVELTGPKPAEKLEDKRTEGQKYVPFPTISTGSITSSSNRSITFNMSDFVFKEAS